MAAAFRVLDRILLAFFSIEYLLRFWTAGEVAAWRSWRGRLVDGPVLAPLRSLPDRGLSPAAPGRRDLHPALPAHRPGLHGAAPDAPHGRRADAGCLYQCPALRSASKRTAGVPSKGGGRVLSFPGVEIG